MKFRVNKNCSDRLIINCSGMLIYLKKSASQRKEIGSLENDNRKTQYENSHNVVTGFRNTKSQPLVLWRKDGKIRLKTLVWSKPKSQ
jgi:hypothetical protein